MKVTTLCEAPTIAAWLTCHLSFLETSPRYECIGTAVVAGTQEEILRVSWYEMRTFVLHPYCSRI